jgi:hypothetical protein
MKRVISSCVASLPFQVCPFFGVWPSLHPVPRLVLDIPLIIAPSGMGPNLLAGLNLEQEISATLHSIGQGLHFLGGCSTLWPCLSLSWLSNILLIMIFSHCDCSHWCGSMSSSLLMMPPKRPENEICEDGQIFWVLLHCILALHYWNGFKMS